MMSATESSSLSAAAATTTASTSSNPTASNKGATTAILMNGNINNNGQQQQPMAVDGSKKPTASGNGRAAATNSTTAMTATTTSKIIGSATKPKQKHHRHSLKSQPSPPTQLNDDGDDDDEEEDDDDNLLHHQYSSSASSLSSLAISGGSSTDNDNAYLTEIARRSVARAALHLGIEGMEGIALDTLGSVLLGYLEMVGTTISTNVETSGRSSAHANAYDAINAISECTAPAAMQMGVAGNECSSVGLSLTTSADQSQPPPPQHGHQHQQHGWEGLASFLFGPEWFSIRLGGEEEFEINNGAVKNGALAVAGGGAAMGNTSNGNTDASVLAPPKKAVSGGKTFLPTRPPSEENNNSSSQPKTGKGKQLLPTMTGNTKTVTFSLDDQHNLAGEGIAATADNDGRSPTDDAVSRWHAPYLYTVPAFPLVKNTKDIANPHRLSGSKVTLSLHDYSTEMEACVDYSPTKRPKKGSVVVVDDQAKKQKAAAIRNEMAERAMRAALRIPDDVYSTMGTNWGSIRKEDGSSTSPFINKNVKLQSIASTAAPAVPSKEKHNNSSKPISFSPKNSAVEKPESDATVPMPSYVPNFLPPYPTDYSSEKHDTELTSSIAAASSVMGNIVSRLHTREKKRKSSSNVAPVDEEHKKSEFPSRDAVRRSVIGLGRSIGPSYWGSNWRAVDPVDDGRRSSGAIESVTNDTISNTLSDISAERGTASSSSAMAAATVITAKKTDGSVAPLSRASGSRLTKILEGSMNLS